MTPDLSLAPPYRVLDCAHAVGRELYLASDGRIWILRRAGAPDALALEVALGQLQGDLLPLLESWVCGYCGRAAELPDGCTRCHQALRHHAQNGAAFVRGSTVFHALAAPAPAKDGDLETACGLILEGGPCDLPASPRVRLALSDFPASSLCRRCLPVLHRLHAEHLGRKAQGAKGRQGRRRGR